MRFIEFHPKRVLNERHPLSTVKIGPKIRHISETVQDINLVAIIHTSEVVHRLSIGTETDGPE